MRKEERRLVQDSLSSVRVYLTNPEELQSKIEKLEKESPNLKEFIDKLKSASSSTEDPTEKTDQRILLNNLQERAP